MQHSCNRRWKFAILRDANFLFFCPFFCEDPVAGKVVTVNTERYLKKLEQVAATWHKNKTELPATPQFCQWVGFKTNFLNGWSPTNQVSLGAAKGMQTPSNLWPWDSLQYTNMTSLPVSLTTHHAVWSWQVGYICIVLLYGVQMYTGVFRPLCRKDNRENGKESVRLGCCDSH